MFSCETCRDANGLPVRLEVTNVRHPAYGLTVRRRRCPVCGRVTLTEEKLRATNPGSIVASAAPPLRT